MSTTVMIAGQLYQQSTVSTVAAGPTLVDMALNWLYDYKILAAVASLTFLGFGGIWMLGRARAAGIALIIGSVALAAFFLRIEKFVDIFGNEWDQVNQPAKHGNPFGRY